MRKPSVIIGFSRGRLEATRISRGRVAARHVEVIPDQLWEMAWDQALIPLDDALARCVNAIEARNAVAEVHHRGPDVLAEIFSFPVPPSKAAEAARMALADAVSYPLTQNICALEIVGRDKSGDTPQTHVLAAADTTRSAEAIRRWVQRAGMTCARMAPLHAPALRNLVNAGLACADQTPNAILHFGRRCSAIVGASGSAINFLRTIEIGSDALVDAMCQPIIRRHEPEPLILDRNHAEGILERFGIPAFDDVIDEARQLKGAEVLPQMQPVLQRLVVETKQSLRFGFDPREAASAHIKIIGPGAATKGLEDILAVELETPIEFAPVSDHKPTDHAAAMSDTPTQLARAADKINLLPHSALMELGWAKARRGLWTGAAAALFIVAADAGWTWMTLEETRNELRIVEPRAAEARQALDNQRTTANLARGVARAHRQIRDHLGESPSWSAFLLDLAHRTPEEINLTDISSGREQSGHVANLRGFAHARNADEPRAVLQQFITELETCPLVASVQLGSTQRLDVDGHSVQDFSLAVTLVGLPPRPASPEGQS